MRVNECPRSKNNYHQYGILVITHKAQHTICGYFDIFSFLVRISLEKLSDNLKIILGFFLRNEKYPIPDNDKKPS